MMKTLNLAWEGFRLHITIDRRGPWCAIAPVFYVGLSVVLILETLTLKARTQGKDRRKLLPVDSLCLSYAVYPIWSFHDTPLYFVLRIFLKVMDFLKAFPCYTLRFLDQIVQILKILLIGFLKHIWYQ